MEGWWLWTAIVGGGFLLAGAIALIAHLLEHRKAVAMHREMMATLSERRKGEDPAPSSTESPAHSRQSSSDMSPYIPLEETWRRSPAHRELVSLSDSNDHVEVRTRREQRSRAQCLQDAGPPSAPDMKTLEALTGKSAANALLRQVKTMQQDSSMAPAVRVLYSEVPGRDRGSGYVGWLFGATEYGLRSGRFVWVDHRGTVTKVQHYEDGWPNGVEAEWWADAGTIKSCGILVDGMRHGEWTEWDTNGQQSVRRSYNLDLKDGVSEAWDEDGTRRLRVNFKLGREDGLSESWHPNGQPHREQVFKEGVHDGPYRAWAPNGQLLEEGVYREGKKDGVWTAHDEEGNLKGTETWEKGNRIRGSYQPLNRTPLTPTRHGAGSRATSDWDRSGSHARLKKLSRSILETPKRWQRRKRRSKEQLLEEVGPPSTPKTKELAVLTGKSAASALERQVRSMGNGAKLIYGMVPGPERYGRPGDDPWREAAGWYFGATKSGLRSGRWVWVNPSGLVVKVQHFEGGWLNGTEATWHGPHRASMTAPDYSDRGSLASLGNYVDGMRHGVWIEWSWRGRMSRRCNYDLDVEDGLSESWHPNGQLMDKGAYKNGEKDGVWVHHDEEGNVTRTEAWEMGMKL